MTDKPVAPTTRAGAPDTSMQNVLRLAGSLHGMASVVTEEVTRAALREAAFVLLAMLQERRNG